MVCLNHWINFMWFHLMLFQRTVYFTAVSMFLWLLQWAVYSFLSNMKCLCCRFWERVRLCSLGKLIRRGQSAIDSAQSDHEMVIQSIVNNKDIWEPEVVGCTQVLNRMYIFDSIFDYINYIWMKSLSFRIILKENIGFVLQAIYLGHLQQRGVLVQW